MIEQRVFIERPMGSGPEHILIVCCFVFLWFGNSFLPQPLPDHIFAVLFLGTYTLILVVSSFNRKLTITCDASGCQVSSKIFWQRSGTIYSFKWSEVTETKFERFYASTSTKQMFFWVVAQGQPRRLLQREWFNADSLDNFVALVNQSTPHLPYVWQKGGPTLGVIEKVGRFSKVLRNQGIVAPGQL